MLSGPRRCALLLLAAVGIGVACGAPRDRELQGAVVIVLDTLRADGLSAYGNPRRTSPHLDALAQEGVLFEQATSHASSTLPGFVGLLSGRYPSARVMDGELRVSLVERLRDAGLRTAAVTEGGFVSSYFGLDRGFQSFVEQEGAVALQIGGVALQQPAGGGIQETFAAARAWLAERASERFFLLVHTYEVHTPYRRLAYAAALERGNLSETFETPDVGRFANDPHLLGPRELAYVRALYDGGVAEADRQVGELRAALRELGLAERTLVVVTSDHGEDLGDREPLRPGTHGHTLYDELLRIPLLVLDPRLERGGARVPGPVRLVDVMPTVLDLLGVAPAPEGEGRSLAALLRGEEASARPAYARIVRRGDRIFKESVRDGRYKLIRNAFPLEPALEVYDLEADPRESQNLAEAREAERMRLEATLRAQRPDPRQDGIARYETAHHVSQALRQRLEALGYAE